MPKLARLPGADRASRAESHVRVPRLRTRFYAFLSYSHKDKELAEWLHRELEKFRVPHALAGKLTANGVVPRRLAPVFRDEQDLSAGGELADEIKAALAASQFLVVLCSPTAAKSRWTNEEIESFKRTRPEGCVLAAIVAGEPFASDLPGREDEECFPPALRYKYDRRGHRTAKRAEPLAADFRADGEGQRLAFLKLVAGMLGVGLDELVQREQGRRQRRLVWLAAASIAGMTVTSGLAVTAIQARDSAREQRRQAEGLVAFMVGDLKDKLEPIGKLDALDGVGSRVLAYYSKQDTSDLSDAALLQRSRALGLVAEVAYMRGHLDDADALYRQAATGSAEAVRRAPKDTKRIFDHAQNIFWLGQIAWTRGDKNGADAEYREYKRLGDLLVSMEPDNLKWRMESLYGRENVGITLLGERRFAEAAQELEGAREQMRNLVAVDPRNKTYQDEFSTALAWAADAQRSLGNLDRAIALRQEQVAVLERAAAGGTADVQVHQNLIAAHQGLGLLLGWRGRLDEGVNQLEAAVAEADQLIPLEPTNNLWKEYSAGARVTLAKYLLASGKPADAAKQTDAGCMIVSQLGQNGSGGANLASLNTACLDMRSRLALLSGSTASALALAQQAVAAAKAEHGADRIKDRYHVASEVRLLGDVRMKSGDSPGAKDEWGAGLAALPSDVSEQPWEMQERADLLRRLARGNEAQNIDRKLSRIGYHSIF